MDIEFKETKGIIQEKPFDIIKNGKNINRC